MDIERVGAELRAIRMRSGRTQATVGRAVRLSAATVSRVERGSLGGVSLGSLVAVARALDARLDVRVRWRGGDLDRLLSGRHAALAEVATRCLTLDGWVVRPEISFAHSGERGIVDLLAWHAPSRTVLVVELKTELVDVGEALGTLDRKRRLAPQIASSVGWDPSGVGTVLVLADGGTNRRRVAAFHASIRAALPADGRRVAAWLRSPRDGLRGTIFLSLGHPSHVRATFGARKRVRASGAK